MQRKLLVVVLTLLLVGGTVSLASAFDSVLTSTLTSQVLQLNCSARPIDGLNSFNYTLSNPAINTSIIGGFTLQFPSVPTGDFVVTQTPVGWVSQIVAAENKINWKWNLIDPANQLDPGETFQFTFTTALPFGGPTAGNASAQDGFGFSGKACGPAPVVPEPMSVMLGLMGLGSIAGVSRFRRK